MELPFGRLTSPPSFLLDSWFEEGHRVRNTGVMLRIVSLCALICVVWGFTRAGSGRSKLTASVPTSLTRNPIPRRIYTAKPFPSHTALEAEAETGDGTRMSFLTANNLLKDNKMGDRGEALADIGKGADLFVLPQGLCIDVKKASAKFQVVGISVDRLRTRELGILAMYLLSEKYLEGASKCADYIASLPTEAPGIMAWTDGEVEALAKCTTRPVLDQLRAMKDDYAAVSSLNTALLPSIHFSLDDFK
jgi:hypothetical protein